MRVSCVKCGNHLVKYIGSEDWRCAVCESCPPRTELRCLPACGAFDRPHLLDECYGPEVVE